MKRIQLTKHASARVEDDVSKETIKALTKMASLAYRKIVKEKPVLTPEEARKLKTRKKRK